ncbi:Ras-related protein Rab-6B [Zancudomyces culisetae]|uniref:Ras-related protein Rab-6B n=1 Tax=Zancudomyces culisetae TaxID=1213189 RepID=A0A1R1PPF6_ZANCU|nr:Ras-related protein Rab-6B [Zancudomyces culisetae]|eukprot:OMH82830.1 Ras-related protein Rab-6B [Zancudomyces culisetae]
MATPAESIPLTKYKLVFLGEQSDVSIMMPFDKWKDKKNWVGKTSIVTRFMYDSFDEVYMERFRSLIPSYIRDSAVAIVIYDITDQASFTKTKHWIEDTRAERGNDVILVLVGNKVDISNERKVTTEEGEKYARDVGAIFMETSAKTGYNVKELFKKIARALPYAETPNPDAVKNSMFDVNLNQPPSSFSGSEGCAC